MAVPPWLWKLAFWVGVAAVCALSLLPLAEPPERESGSALRHGAAYFTLMAVGYGAYRDPRSELRLIGSLIGLGLALEATQAMIPERFMSALDAIANTAGIGLACLVVRLGRRAVRR